MVKRNDDENWKKVVEEKNGNKINKEVLFKTFSEPKELSIYVRFLRYGITPGGSDKHY